MLYIWVCCGTLTTTKTRQAQGWSSTVDVYKRNDIEAHKFVPGC